MKWRLENVRRVVKLAVLGRWRPPSHWPLDSGWGGRTGRRKLFEGDAVSSIWVSSVLLLLFLLPHLSPSNVGDFFLDPLLVRSELDFVLGGVLSSCNLGILLDVLLSWNLCSVVKRCAQRGARFLTSVALGRKPHFPFGTSRPSPGPLSFPPVPRLGTESIGLSQDCILRDRLSTFLFGACSHKSWSWTYYIANLMSV